jgi:hypothetical protein
LLAYRYSNIALNASIIMFSSLFSIFFHIHLSHVVCVCVCVCCRRVRSDRSLGGLEPRALYNLIDFLMMDSNADGVISVDEARHLMFVVSLWHAIAFKLSPFPPLTSPSPFPPLPSPFFACV